MGGGLKEYIDLAIRKLKIAEHIAANTYPAVKNPRLLLSALENVFLAYDYAMNAVLEYERLGGRVQEAKKTFPARFSLFRRSCADRLGFDKQALLDFRDIRRILQEHKKSPLEFTRNNRMVICDNNYSMRIITYADVQSYLSSARGFVERAQSTTKRANIYVGQPSP